MPENHTTALIKPPQSPALARVSNQLALTDKLLTKPEEPFLIPYRKGNKWGFCDRDKNIVIDCVYDNAEPFEEGLAKVESNRKWGFIDQKGNNICGQMFEKTMWSIGHYIEGFRCVNQNKKYGCINNYGKFVIPCVSDKPIGINEGMTNVHNAATEVSVFISIENNSTFSVKNWGNFWYAGNFSEGLAAFGADREKYKLGFLNQVGEIVIPPVYDFTHNGSCLYDERRYTFINGLCAVCINEKWGVINKKNDIIVPLLYEDIWIEDSCFILAIEDELSDTFVYYDYSGNILDLPLLPLFDFTYESQLISSHKDDKWGYINKKFEIVIEPKYDYADNFHGGLAYVEKNDLWGYIDSKDNLVIDFQFSRASSFKNGFAQVKSGSNWGIINKTGKLVVDYKYGSIYELYKSGLARVRGISKNRDYIDINGIEYWED